MTKEFKNAATCWKAILADVTSNRELLEDIKKFAEDVGFPVLIRPSYVLSGAAMNVVSNDDELEHFLNMAAKVSKQYPVVVSEFIDQRFSGLSADDAKEKVLEAVEKSLVDIEL